MTCATKPCLYLPYHIMETFIIIWRATQGMLLRLSQSKCHNIHIINHLRKPWYSNDQVVHRSVHWGVCCLPHLMRPFPGIPWASLYTGPLPIPSISRQDPLTCEVVSNLTQSLYSETPRTYMNKFITKAITASSRHYLVSISQSHTVRQGTQESCYIHRQPSELIQ